MVLVLDILLGWSSERQDRVCGVCGFSVCRVSHRCCCNNLVDGPAIDYVLGLFVQSEDIVYDDRCRNLRCEHVPVETNPNGSDVFADGLVYPDGACRHLVVVLSSVDDEHPDAHWHEPVHFPTLVCLQTWENANQNDSQHIPQIEKLEWTDSLLEI